METSIIRMRPAEIRDARFRTPYLAWFDGSYYANLHSHPMPRDPITGPPSQSHLPTWREEYPRGSRHVLDEAPFTLWDESRGDYRNPRNEEARWIMRTYTSQELNFRLPFLLIATDNPSLPHHDGKTTLTVAGMPVIFSSLATVQQGFRAGIPMCDGLCLINISFNIDLPTYSAVPWQPPTNSQAQEILDVLKERCDIKAMNFVWPFLVVELAKTDRLYEKDSLPSKIGNWCIWYHQGPSYWDDEKLCSGRVREMDPENSDQGDTTNYLRTGVKSLGPGVRVEGRNMFCSSGLRIRKGTDIRITVANHAFEGCDNVFHPDGTRGDSIGFVRERFLDEDWALVELHPGIAYSNNLTFESPKPTRLLRKDEAAKNEWYVCDGVTTGKVALYVMGHQYVVGASQKKIVDLTEMQPRALYYATTPQGATEPRGTTDTEHKSSRQGICGAPIIHQTSGEVAGFFQYIHETGYCYAPVLDGLIGEGWDLC